MRYRYYLSLLNESEQRLYADICEKISVRSQYIDVSATIPTVQRVLKAILLDTPDFFWFQGKWRAEAHGNDLRIIPKYSISNDKERIIHNKIKQIISDAAVQSNGSKTGLIRRIYERILDNVRYGQSCNDQTIEGVFIDAVAVCKGISKAFQICMNAIDVPCILTEGTLNGQESHIWNIIFFEGKAYHIDVTMGYSRFSEMFSTNQRIPRYSCFMVSDKSIKKTHHMYSNGLPICNADFDVETELIKESRIPPKFYEYGKIRYLNRGSTCSVFKVEGDSDRFALKVLLPSAFKNSFDASKKELMIMRQLSGCEYIVPLADSVVNETDGYVYLLFPLLKSLSTRRRERDFDFYRDTQRLGIDILNALIECKNKGIYHLDIQPKNIYFDNHGKALLGDFGGSAFEHELPSLSRCKGTLAFMAPEVYLHGKYSEASEIYSLGIIMYSILNNAKLPFTGSANYEEALRQRLNGGSIPPPCTGESALWDCISKMCEYDVDKRTDSYTKALHRLISI